MPSCSASALFMHSVVTVVFQQHLLLIVRVCIAVLWWCVCSECTSSVCVCIDSILYRTRDVGGWGGGRLLIYMYTYRYSRCVKGKEAAAALWMSVWSVRPLFAPVKAVSSLCNPGVCYSGQNSTQYKHWEDVVLVSLFRGTRVTQQV